MDTRTDVAWTYDGCVTLTLDVATARALSMGEVLTPVRDALRAALLSPPTEKESEATE